MCELPFIQQRQGARHCLELAKRLVRMAPAGMGKALFIIRARANDTAIKLAWYINNAGPVAEKRCFRQRVPA
jgi:adenosylmethionine-8-amino-7-oxononanoate aminotransferase